MENLQKGIIALETEEKTEDGTQRDIVNFEVIAPMDFWEMLKSKNLLTVRTGETVLETKTRT